MTPTTTALPAAPPRGRQTRHSTQTMRLARQMYGDGGTWTPTQISRYLAGRGIHVHVNTIRLWVIPGLAEQQRAANRRSHRARQPGPESLTPMLDRMRELRGAGLGAQATAKVLTLDFGVPVNRDQVRYCLRHGREFTGLQARTGRTRVPVSDGAGSELPTGPV